MRIKILLYNLQEMIFMKKNIGELDLKISKKLLSYKDTTFSKEEGKILYDFLNN